jgi:hypothetical protein
MPFRKGVSGNPSGRRAGSKNKSTDLRERYSRDLPAIHRQLIKAAKEGQPWAVSLVMSKCYPPLKPVQQPGALSGDFSGDSLTEQGKAVVASMAAGELSVDDAKSMLSALADMAKLVEHCDFDERLKRLEQQHDGS